MFNKLINIVLIATFSSIVSANSEKNPSEIQADNNHKSAMEVLLENNYGGAVMLGGEAKHSISTANIARKHKNENLWDWTVYLKASDDVLQKIKHVEYTLHPSFPDPVRIIKNRGAGPHAFPLSTAGWGTFKIQIKVHYKDDTVQNLSHALKF